MNRLPYKCLVLDHDDTVTDSTRHVHHPAFLEALNELRPGVSVSLDDYFRLNFHPGFMEYCEQALSFTPAEFEREMEIWKAYVAGHVPAAFPGMRELMQEQIARGGYVCVCSHSLQENILRDYRENGLPQPTLVYGWDLPRALRKPNPFALDDIMDRLQLSAKDLLVVDDLKPGFDMAAQRGVAFAAAGWAYAVPEIRRFMQKNAALYFDTVAALKGYLFD